MFSTKDSRAKLDRARIHLSEMYSGFHGFLDGSSLNIPLYLYCDVENSQIVAAVREMPIMPNNFGILIGDAIHNYRSSLDYLWWQIAVKNIGRSPTKQEESSIQFPIFSDAANWGRHRYFNHVPAAGLDFIKDIQPFNFDNDEKSYSPLLVLNELSNRDKHRALVPVLVLAKQAGYVNFTDRNVRLADCELPAVINVGAEIARFTLDLEGIEAEKAIQASFSSYISIHNNIIVFDALEAIDELCDTVLEIAERRFG